MITALDLSIGNTLRAPAGTEYIMSGSLHVLLREFMFFRVGFRVSRGHVRRRWSAGGRVLGQGRRRSNLLPLEEFHLVCRYLFVLFLFGFSLIKSLHARFKCCLFGSSEWSYEYGLALVRECKGGWKWRCYICDMTLQMYGCWGRRPLANEILAYRSYRSVINLQSPGSIPKYVLAGSMT